MASKIHFLYEWKELTRYITMDNIQIPDETKEFITKAYVISKVNNKGKIQDRVLKFTSNSILNIDPKSKAIKNEKLITDIKIISCPDDTTITLEFTEESEKRSSTKGFFQDSEDLRYRTYICRNKSQREEIIEDLFRSFFYLKSTDHPLEYRIRKVRRKQLQSLRRTYKFTIDSILSLEGEKIKKEMPFYQISSITRDEMDQKVICINRRGLEHLKIVLLEEEFTEPFFELLSTKVRLYNTEANTIESDLVLSANIIYRNND